MAKKECLTTDNGTRKAQGHNCPDPSGALCELEKDAP